MIIKTGKDEKSKASKKLIEYFKQSGKYEYGSSALYECYLKIYTF